MEVVDVYDELYAPLLHGADLVEIWVDPECPRDREDGPAGLRLKGLSGLIKRPDRRIEAGAIKLRALELAEHVNDQRRFNRQDLVCLAV